MTNQQHMYRRGAIYWWRRVLDLSPSVRYDMRVSLRTAIKTEARQRAGYLTAIAGSVCEMSNPTDDSTDRRITASELIKMRKDGFDRALAHFILVQSKLPGQPVLNRQLNEAAADFYQWMIDSNGDLGPMPDQYIARLRALEFDDDRISRLALTIESEASSQPAINPSTIFHALDEINMRHNKTNYDIVRRELWVAFRDAAHAAEADRKSRADGSIKSPQSQYARPPYAEDIATAPAAKAPDQQQATGPTQSSVTIEEAMEECIKAARPLNGDIYPSEVQIRTAVRLLIYGTGPNFPISKLDQSHLGKMAALMKDLPNRWGRTADELERGIVASLERAKTLPPEEVGVSIKTQDKHFTWVRKVVEYAARYGFRPDIALNYSGFKKDNKETEVRDRNLRANWTADEVRTLLECPIWSGCQGLMDIERLKPGQLVFHDAWYFAPVAFIHMAGRSAEFIGIPLSDVHTDDAIPYFSIKPGKLRRLKNAQSVRNIPIHPELIRLGFLDYVEAMRRDGHEQLFPEMHSANSASFAGTFYKKVFKPLRDAAFPNGTVWRHRDRGANVDKDVHSFRGLAASLMAPHVPEKIINDILGHEGKTTTSKTYQDPTSLPDMLLAMAYTSHLTEILSPLQLNLRPRHLRAFGATAAKGGRPHKAKL